MRIKSMYTFVIDFFLAIIFEKDSLLKKIEKMSPERFKNECILSDSSIAPFSYKDPLVRTIIWNMKYRKNKKCFKLAAKILHMEIVRRMENIKSKDIPLLIPVPLSKKRRKERGYNQTEELAKELHRIDNGKNFTLNAHIVFKIIHTKQQTKLPRHDRASNLINTFAIKNPLFIKNENIILLDDVFTTGATMNEITKLLKRHGARNVFPIAFARA